MSGLPINPAKMQLKKNVTHITQAPESMDYAINLGILSFLVMGFSSAPRPGFWQLIISLNIFGGLLLFVFQLL